MTRPLGPASIVGGALADLSLQTASSSEPPASVGLACRPVGACRRHLMKQLDSMRDGPRTHFLWRSTRGR